MRHQSARGSFWSKKIIVRLFVFRKEPRSRGAKRQKGNAAIMFLRVATSFVTDGNTVALEGRVLPRGASLDPTSVCLPRSSATPAIVTGGDGGMNARTTAGEIATTRGGGADVTVTVTRCGRVTNVATGLSRPESSEPHRRNTNFQF